VLEGEGYRVTRVEGASTPFMRSKIGRSILEQTRRGARHAGPVYWVAERSP
jgi:hypothetical protein